jgi:pimeloyl-ACP methyl ester carboxylesterase
MSENLSSNNESSTDDPSQGEGRVEIEDVGGSSNLEPLLLIHGFSATVATWDAVIDDLSERYDVQLIKLRGHFGGDPFKEGIRPSFLALVDAVEEAMDEAGIESAHVAGNSLGGWIGMELGARGRARSVVAMSPAGGWVRHPIAELRIAPIFVILRVTSKLGLPLRRFIARSAALRRSAMALVLRHGERVAPKTVENMIEGTARCPIFWAFLIPALGKQTMLPRRFEQPVTFMWGTQDHILPLSFCADGWLQKFPDAKWQILPDVGHLTPLDVPELTIAAIDDAVARSKSVETGSDALKVA